MIKVYRAIVVQSQSLWSALRTASHHFEVSDNIVSGMSASSTVAIFSVDTVSLVRENYLSTES